MVPADARYPSANSMSVLIPGTIWMRAPLPARLMPQPSLRPKPATFQTTVPLAGKPSSFCPAEGPVLQAIQPVTVTAVATTTSATALTVLPGKPLGRRLTGSAVDGGGVLAAD